MGVGIRLKNLLKHKGMTARELSEITGISINTIYAILKRDNDSIKPESLLKISNVLNVSPNYILGITEVSKSEKNNVDNKIDLINQWLQGSAYRITVEPITNIYTLRDSIRNVVVYLDVNEIDKLYSDIKTSCEYTVDKFIYNQLKEN